MLINYTKTAKQLAKSRKKMLKKEKDLIRNIARFSEILLMTKFYL